MPLKPLNKAKQNKPADERPWWEGGTLHKGTIADWHQAELANHWATCADFVVGLRNNYETTIILNPNDPMILLGYVLQLCTCITEGTKNHIKEAGHFKITDLVVYAAGLLGWFKYNKVKANPVQAAIEQALSDHLDKPKS